jgi:hypothetical protein
MLKQFQDLVTFFKIFTPLKGDLIMKWKVYQITGFVKYKALYGLVEKHIRAKNVSWKNIYGLKTFRGRTYIGFVEIYIALKWFRGNVYMG